jgi:predicted nucleic acid-binding protein
LKPFGSGVPLVIDTSAWARQREPRVLGPWRKTHEEGLFASCPVAALEILQTAREESEFEALETNLAALPQVPVTASACRAALGACRELGGRRRIPAADYLIAAAAAERGFGVLHADRHFGLLAEVLAFESVRIEAGD